MVTVNILYKIRVILNPGDKFVTTLDVGENEVSESLAAKLINRGAAEAIESGEPEASGE